MEYPLLKASDIKTHYFRNQEAGYSQACLFTNLDGVWFVMAKSVVKAIIEKEYLQGKDPFIDKIIEVFGSQVSYFQIRDKSILQKVWSPPSGDFRSVTFVPIKELIPNLSEIFSEVEEEDLLDAQDQLKGFLDKIKLSGVGKV